MKSIASSSSSAPNVGSMSDIGLTHIALSCADLEASIRFYETFAAMNVVHRRVDADEGVGVAWLSDHTRPFVIVLIESDTVEHPLRPDSHLGVGCESREEVDRLCSLAKDEGRLLLGPKDSGPPVGYWALIEDPDGHTLEVAHGQEVALTVNASSGDESR